MTGEPAPSLARGMNVGRGVACPVPAVVADGAKALYGGLTGDAISGLPLNPVCVHTHTHTPPLRVRE
jgi:hypothetical protein